MTAHNERDSKAAEEYALRVAKNFSTVPDDKLSRHDIAKAAKCAHEEGIAYGRADTETGKELHFRKAQIEVLEEELTALKATLAVYKEALEFYADRKSWWSSPYDYKTGMNSNIFEDTESNEIHGGKRAREALQKLRRESVETDRKEITKINLPANADVAAVIKHLQKNPGGFVLIDTKTGKVLNS